MRPVRAAPHGADRRGRPHPGDEGYPAFTPELSNSTFRRATEVSPTPPAMAPLQPAGAPLRAILEIAFAYIHSRFRTDNDFCSRLRSWRPERQQSLHRGPTALRCRPIALASRRRTAAPAGVSRQSRYARRRVDHHVTRAPYAGGQSGRGPGETGRTDRPRSSGTENTPPQPAHARLQGPPAHGKIATLRLQETARADERRLSWLILAKLRCDYLKDRRRVDCQRTDSEVRLGTRRSTITWRAGTPADDAPDSSQAAYRMTSNSAEASTFVLLFRDSWSHSSASGMYRVAARILSPLISVAVCGLLEPVSKTRLRSIPARHGRQGSIQADLWTHKKPQSLKNAG